MTTKTEIRAANPDWAKFCAVGTKGGPFLFFGSQTPHDPETGTLATGFADLPGEAKRNLATGMQFMDVTEERILAQAWRIYTNLEEMLAGHGATLDHVVRQRFFLRDLRDQTSLEKVIQRFNPTERPATTIVEATNRGVNDEISVQADFVAIDGAAGIRRVAVSVPDLDHLTAPYPLATRAGQFLFTSSMAGVNADTGRLAQRFDELTAEERELLEPPYSAPEETVAAQHIMAFRQIRRILESQGAPLGSHVHQNCWLRVPMQEWGQVSKVRRKLFQGLQNMAPSTALPVSGVFRRDASFEVEIIALVPSDDPTQYRKEVRLEAHPLTGFYLSAVNAGPFVLTAGEVAIDTSVPRLVNGFDQIEGAGRGLPFGRIHEDKPIMAESWCVYSKLKDYVEASGATMGDVVHQSVFMVHPAEFPALERIAALFFGAKLPPTTLVPVLGATPYREATLEIEVVAVADGA